ncbi:actin depolymerizing protein [Sparassis latifolia]
MADVSDTKIGEAYQDVRDDKTETNWLLLDYESDRSDKLHLTATGTGGLDELREQLNDSTASYAYARVQYANDKESKREKFIYVVWVGPQCKIMRKAKARTLSEYIYALHSGDVKSVLHAYSIEVAARENDDLKEEPIVARLRKAGGASYDGV